MSLNTTPIIHSPMYIQLLIDKLTKARREARVEWLQIRDKLDVQQNANYIDLFQESLDQINQLRDMLRGHDNTVFAQLN